MRVRKLALLAGVIATVGMVAYDPRDRKATNVAPREISSPVSAIAPKPLEDELPQGRALREARGELFGAPPPPAPPPAAAIPTAAAAPVVQVAPPLPYRFAGRVRKGAEEEFLLSKGDLVFPVKEGDTIDGSYKVLALKPDGIELVYTPLGTTQRIAVTSALDAVEAPRPVLASAPAPQPVVPILDSRPARLRWDGPKQVQLGGNFTVALRVSTQEPLRAAPMQLRYAPGVLEPVEVRPGKLIGDGAFSYRVNREGSIFVGATVPGAAPGTDAELVLVTFRPLKAGATAEVSMSAMSLQGAAGRAIAHEQPAAFRTAIQ